MVEPEHPIPDIKGRLLLVDSSDPQYVSVQEFDTFGDLRLALERKSESELSDVEIFEFHAKHSVKKEVNFALTEVENV